jgi:hypothetical protein
MDAREAEPMRGIAPAIERRVVVARPYPPAECGENWPVTFVPAPELRDWIHETFIAGSGPLAIEEHAHLMDASIGVLWTNAINVTKMRTILATAEMPGIQAGGWRRARHEYQLRQWFDVEPDFLLTFSAPDCAQLDDREFCALVMHELLHCAQAEDAFGALKFHRETGAPLFAIKGHDVEEFTSVVRYFGVTSPAVRALVDAAQRPPLFGWGSIAIACGTCQARAA